MTTAKRTVIGAVIIVIVAVIAIGAIFYAWAMVKQADAPDPGTNQSVSSPH